MDSAFATIADRVARIMDSPVGCYLKIIAWHEPSGLVLLRSPHGRGWVVYYDRERNQVHSAMVSDRPPGKGCVWAAWATTTGVEYVARSRTWEAARAAFRRLVARGVSLHLRAPGGHGTLPKGGAWVERVVDDKSGGTYR